MGQGSNHQQYLELLVSCYASKSFPYFGSVYSYKPSDPQLLASDFQLVAQPLVHVEVHLTAVVLLYVSLEPVLLGHESEVEAETEKQLE